VKDIAIHSKLQKNVELITNTFTEKLFKIRKSSTLNQKKLCHVLIIEILLMQYHHKVHTIQLLSRLVIINTLLISVILFLTMIDLFQEKT